MKGHILTVPKLIDERRISFLFLPDEGGRQISCTTAVNPDAPEQLEKMKKWKHVSIDDSDWIPDEKGQPVTLRVNSIHEIKHDKPAKVHS